MNDAQCIHLDRVLTVEAGEHIGLVALRGALGLAAASSAGGGCAYTIARHASSSDALTCGTTLKFTRACGVGRVGFFRVPVTALCRVRVVWTFLHAFPPLYPCSLRVALSSPPPLPLSPPPSLPLSPPVTLRLSQLYNFTVHLTACLGLLMAPRLFILVTFHSLPLLQVTPSPSCTACPSSSMRRRRGPSFPAPCPPSVPWQGGNTTSVQECGSCSASHTRYDLLFSPTPHAHRSSRAPL